MTDPRKPFVYEVEEIADPASAPPVPEAPDEMRRLAAVESLAALSGARLSGLTRFAFWVFGSLFTFVLSVAAWNFVTDLLGENSILGWIAFGLVGLAVLVLLALALREVMGFARIARLDHLRIEARTAIAAADLKAARGVTTRITDLYKNRADAAWGIAEFAQKSPDLIDADALLIQAEADILAPLDLQARLEIEAAVRRVSLVTAIVPLALADVAVALYANVSMIRRIAMIYGGRSGVLGSMSLLRRVVASLLGAGAVALADDLLGSVAGGGVLSKLSRRLGEGVVNGALTARVGIAAMEECRPLPFIARDRPGVPALLSRALKGLVPQGLFGGKD